jgi:hypothetical protein
LNKFIPYLFGLFLIGAIVLLLSTSSTKSNKKTLDESITLFKQDKIPYGSYVAYQDLKYIFPQATISENKYEPGYWDSLSKYEDKQALIILTTRFIADETEMKKLVAFAENGNDVFIASGYFSPIAKEMMSCEITGSYNSLLRPAEYLDDSLQLNLNNLLFGPHKQFHYPGRTSSNYFSSVDTALTEVLGYNRNFQPNFIKLRAGHGNFYIHTDPFAFTNYFLLFEDNVDYYEKALSLIRPDVKKVVWDEYYLMKKENRNQAKRSDKEHKQGWLAALMNVQNANGDKSFGAAFILLAAILMLYVLLNMRRKQRYIPVIKNPSNDSLDFVKTIGRLYFDKANHKNLCRKMASFFLDHVRNRYKLPTGNLDAGFVSKLLEKSGAESYNTNMIISYINSFESDANINQEQVIQFYNQLENFYKSTS